MKPIKTNFNHEKNIAFIFNYFLAERLCRVVSITRSRSIKRKNCSIQLNSAISYGVKKQTGKTPLEHAIAYAEEKNPERKKETCISSFEITRSEFCTIVKKQIKLKSTAVIKKTQIL